MTNLILVLIVVCIHVYISNCFNKLRTNIRNRQAVNVNPLFATLMSPPGYHLSSSSSSTISYPKVEVNKNLNVLDDVNPEKLPWSTSIAETSKLTYMPMFKHQLDLIRSMGMEEIPLDKDIAYQKSSTRQARIANLCFRNDQFRCVRLTYFDGGDAVQVFNSLWYPSYEYDLPLLGMDLISLGKNRLMNVIDFQPLHPTTEYSAKYIDHLSTIRSKYPDLHGVLSGKIYDDTSFFSKNMLFGRFPDDSKVNSVVLPAYREYLSEYVSLMDGATPNKEPQSLEIVQQRQKAYDCYSALKDPAVGLFDAYFGKAWSKKFVHDYLFQLSESDEESLTESSNLNNVPVPKNENVHTFSIGSDGTVNPVRRS